MRSFHAWKAKCAPEFTMFLFSFYKNKNRCRHSLRIKLSLIVIRFNHLARHFLETSLVNVQYQLVHWFCYFLKRTAYSHTVLWRRIFLVFTLCTETITRWGNVIHVTINSYCAYFLLKWETFVDDLVNSLRFLVETLRETDIPWLKVYQTK